MQTINNLETGSDLRTKLNANFALVGTTYFPLDGGTITGPLILPPTTSSTTGVILKGADRFLHNFALAGTNGFNTFLGVGSGNFTLTGSVGTQGSYLTCLGSGAGGQITTGSSNTYVGTNAGYSTTTGSYNACGGHSAGYYIDVGIYNTAWGYQAGDGLRSNGYNTLVGANAGYGLVSGDYNVMVGNDTGVFANGAAANTIVGSSAAYSITSGATIVAVGANAGYNNTTGANNIYIGFNAGLGITTGSGNVIIGKATGLASGLANTIILADGDGNQRLTINSSGAVSIPGGLMTPNIGVASGTSVLLNSSTADGITGRFIAQGSGSPFAVYAEAIGAATQNVGLYSVVSGGTANIGFMINVAAGANHYAILTIGTAKSSLGGALEIAGGFTPASLADGSATNGTIYYSTTASKLAYKDSGGVVNALY